mgnify:FL=1
MEIIGIVGPFGSGKSTVAKYLEKKFGYEKITLSSFLRKEANNRGVKKMTRKLLQDIGNEFRVKMGPEVLAKLAIEEVKLRKIKKAIIDGIRNPAEIEFLRKQGNFILWGISANIKYRFQRLKKLKSKAVLSWEDFQKYDARDKGKGQKTTGLLTGKCFDMAERMIENNGTKKEFLEQINKFIKKT